VVGSRAITKNGEEKKRKRNRTVQAEKTVGFSTGEYPKNKERRRVKQEGKPRAKRENRKGGSNFVTRGENPHGVRR